MKSSPSKRLCLKEYYRNILLLVNFNHPFYQNIPLIKRLYNRIFPNMVFYGTEKSNKYNVKKIDSAKGYLSYIGLADAMEHHRNYTGYLLINDDVFLNPWTIGDLDQSRVWEGPKRPITLGKFRRTDIWSWWKHPRWGLSKCLLARNESISTHPELLEIASTAVEKDAENRIQGCYRGRSDVLYVPKQFSNQFIALSQIFYKHKVFLEIAIPTIIRMTVKKSNRQTMRGVYLPGRVNDTSIRNTTNLWKVYDETLHFIHPVKLNYQDNGTKYNKLKMERIKNKINSMIDCTRKK